MPGLSLFCLNCNSRDDPKCDDPLDLARLAYGDCSSGYFKALINEAAGNFTEVQDAFLSYTSVANSELSCQKLVVKGESYDFCLTVSL
jgi:hypothetical protein